MPARSTRKPSRADRRKFVTRRTYPQCTKKEKRNRRDVPLKIRRTKDLHRALDGSLAKGVAFSFLGAALIGVRRLFLG